MFKKLFSIISILICSVLFTGCINMKITDEYTVNKDMSVDHTYQLLVDNSMSGFSDEINSGLHENLAERGFSNIVNAYEGNYFGKKGSKHIEADSNFGESFNNKYVRVTDNTKDYLLFKHVDITANIDFQSLMEGTADSELINLNEYKLTINLPVKFTESNAQNVYNENKSATWSFVPKDGKGIVHFECNVLNMPIIIILLAVLFAAVAFLVLAKFVSTILGTKTLAKNTCSNCGTAIKGDEVFCGNCGAQIDKSDAVLNKVESNEASKKCPKCSATISEEDVFCAECGSILKEEVSEVNNEV